MPIKFKESQTVRDRATGKPTTTNYYITGTSEKELVDYINGSNSKPRIKQKCRNELVRRGIKIEDVQTA